MLVELSAAVTLAVAEPELPERSLFQSNVKAVFFFSSSFQRVNVTHKREMIQSLMMAVMLLEEKRLKKTNSTVLRNGFSVAEAIIPLNLTLSSNKLIIYY